MVDRGVSSAYLSFQGPSKILTMKNKWKIFSSLSNCLGSSKHWKQQQEIRNKKNYISPYADVGRTHWQERSEFSILRCNEQHLQFYGLPHPGDTYGNKNK